MKRVLLVDMLNMYFRAYIVDPSLSTNGDPIGGLKGTLKILQKMCREMNPDEVFLCWDGRSGSARRRSVNEDYKKGRKPLKVNRVVDNLTDGEQLENRIWQQTRLIEYFNEMPFCQIMLEHTEADDVIAFLARTVDAEQKIIVSNDKDFYQLLDNETLLWRPTQKELLSAKDVLEKTGIHPRNFTIARAIDGDKSDNLPGIKGAGLKTLAKRFPILKEDRDITFQDLYGLCESVDKKLKIHSAILENKKLIEENYGIMQLYNSHISPQNTNKIREAVGGYSRSFNKTKILGMMIDDGFAEMNWSDLFTRCRIIARGEN